MKVRNILSVGFGAVAIAATTTAGLVVAGLTAVGSDVAREAAWEIAKPFAVLSVGASLAAFAIYHLGSYLDQKPKEDSEIKVETPEIME